ncbi:MAG: TerC family protein [Planctomycetes bacterium]|nr:TerC family protein [Planctomycetota bacterium]
MLTDPESWIALLTLTVLEIVLGVDNIIFISILCGRLPSERRAAARRLGLILAMLMRIGLLLSISWVMRLEDPLLTLGEHAVSGKDLILLVGGLFLLGKSTHEIHAKLEGAEEEGQTAGGSSFGSVILQIALLDIVFSLDSVITAVGMVDHVSIMVAAIIVAVGFMMFFARAVGEFVERHPTVKMLALSFLILIGMALIADGLHHHIPKGYIYFAMGFSVFVELLNLRLQRKGRPVRLHREYRHTEDEFTD